MILRKLADSELPKAERLGREQRRTRDSPANSSICITLSLFIVFKPKRPAGLANLIGPGAKYITDLGTESLSDMEASRNLGT